MMISYQELVRTFPNAPRKKDIDDIICAMGVFNELLNKKGKSEIETIAPSVHQTYSLAKRISTKINGYCSFNEEQIHYIKKAVTPFSGTQKFSKRINLLFIREYCLIKKIKYQLRSVRTKV
ncbi:hypothetical protein [Citrobacter freundii]|uniref:hypothetical protein n=1 Tax=Citrobacter freundii TaxID=546 RepID=UPI0012902334|nr:hypothetical protein [Citrobacter freundii]